MNAIPRLPIRPEVGFVRALMAFALVAGVGCHRREPALHLHYLSGFVPGTRNLFAPVTIAIAPLGGKAMQDRLEVGAVYGSDGNIQRKLYVEDFRTVLAEALASGLKDAGLKPALLSQAPPDLKPPEGSQFLLSAAVEELRVDKHFGAQTTVHGRYFTMHSRVKIGVQLFDRSGRQLFLIDVTGVEDEPPAPVGGEVFLPLETDPAESLSVAISRAIGALILEPKMRRYPGPALTVGKPARKCCETLTRDCARHARQRAAIGRNRIYFALRVL